MLKNEICSKIFAGAVQLNAKCSETYPQVLHNIIKVRKHCNMVFRWNRDTYRRGRQHFCQNRKINDQPQTCFETKTKNLTVGGPRGREA